MAGVIRSDPCRRASKLPGRSRYANQEAAKFIAPRETDCGDLGGCRVDLLSTKAVSTYRSGIQRSRAPVVEEGGMPAQNAQQKPGTARGSPRRSRTAKA